MVYEAIEERILVFGGISGFLREIKGLAPGKEML